MTQIFLGLGSNIDPEMNLQKAAALLREHFPDIEFSSVYRTAAREVEDQNDFLNTVATCDTQKSSEDIYRILQSIEQSLGKAPPFRFGPRTIDLDLLLHGNKSQIINSKSQIVLPHPRMHERRFVLEPLCELIDPQFKHPVIKQSWEYLLEKTLEQECVLTDIAL
ncbi:2-amino-4-hydroxy-6-hydroxymethyldihydropteridine diphosphokinase [Candidatus Peribacteria bacterium RIFCSPHIGHO2_01_FULL_55_13]|nr:MAG: 2-amino-4-hydroxy-6-hydroxymethyldihydropteridine diphosphokinase [Candidatus Peribacteria bacterium RIFCSPHIGHO2_01_FULL_55_13]OGJ64350.1 MAG: 2-amino-4-hydroxy-6-hydroxymethyldihydropteridine diphosphokinase [Candidatus Peribacteria bacterium RIFCSPHIGHO2_12_FULL_55_11]